MASTITNATLTLTITESLTLGGTQFGGSKTLEIANINEAFKRIVKCANSQTTTIATFNGNAFAADNAIDLEDAKYISDMMLYSKIDDYNRIYKKLGDVPNNRIKAVLVAEHFSGRLGRKQYNKFKEILVKSNFNLEKAYECADEEEQTQ